MEFFKTLKILPRWIIVILDTLIVFQCGVLGYLIRFNFELSSLENYFFLFGVTGFTVAVLLAMLVTKSYKGIVRHTGIRDAYNITKTISFAFVGIVVLNSFRVSQFDLPHLMPVSVLVISSVLSLLLMMGYRAFVKEFFDYLRNGFEQRNLVKIAIFGAGEAGMITQDVLKRDSLSKIKTVAFLDDDPQKQGKVIKGIRIYKGIEELDNLVCHHGVSEVVIAVNNLSVQRKRDLIDACLKLQIHTRIIAPVNKWVDGGLTTNDIREVKIEDLLGRDEIVLGDRNLEKDFFGKVILVTGAAGSIGSELCRQLVHHGPKMLVMVDQSESALYDLEQELRYLSPMSSRKFLLADIRNVNKMKEIFNKNCPQVVFHAAAYKHVPLMEKYPQEAIACNILGTKNLADLSARYEVEKFILVSTDKAVNPTNVMGASKRAAEMYVQSLNDHISIEKGSQCTKFITTRFGNVLGSNGSVIPLFQKQIQKGGPVTVTHPEIMRYFMTIPEACQLVLEAAVMGNGGEIYAFDMGEPIKIHDLAKKMIQLSGKKIGIDIKIEFTGLRDGEKLFEELLNEAETVVLTHHPKIKIAQVSPVSFGLISQQLEKFSGLLEKENENNLILQLKRIVPEYISNSSRFGVLDRLN